MIDEKKLIDQTAKADKGKHKLSLVPPEIIRAIAVIREYGNNKYPEGGKDNWKTVELERYRDALYRHWLTYLENPGGVDEESGLPHLWHAACNMAFLCELEKEKLRLCELNDLIKERPKFGEWIPVSERLPEEGEYILLSFENFTVPTVGRYEEDTEGGAFYVGDDDETCVQHDVFVNAWMPLPEPWEGEK